MSGYGKSLASLFSQLSGGDVAIKKAEIEGHLDGSRAFQADASGKQSLAQALKAQAEANEIKAQGEMRSPASLLRNSLTRYGVPQSELQAVETYMNTGKLGGAYDVAADGMGPVAPQPSWANKLHDVGRHVSGITDALAVGDKSVENVAKAASISRESRMKDGVMAGQVDPLLLAKAEYAGSGKAPFNFNEYGTGNNITGKLDEATGAAKNFADKRKSETGENIAQAGAAKASAASSYASAGASNARAAQTRQETQQGSKGVLRDTDQGLVLVNPLTGQATPVNDASGKPLQGKTTAAKPMPGAAMKMQNEELDAIGTFSGLNADLAGLEKQIADGKLKFGLASNVINQGRNYIGNSNEESRNLASFKSKMESMRNSVLLLNKGVQTEGDAQRAMNEIFANINDQDVVKQRLAEIQALNKRAVELRKNNVGVLRRNYGQDDMDFTKIESQPAATNLQPAQFDAEKERRYQEFKRRQAQ